MEIYEYEFKKIRDRQLMNEANLDRTNFLGTKHTDKTLLYFKKELTSEEKLRLDNAVKNHVVELKKEISELQITNEDIMNKLNDIEAKIK